MVSVHRSFPINLIAFFSWNDIIKITFDASKGQNDEPTRLSGASSVFLCANALLQDSTTTEVCIPNEKNAMRFVCEIVGH
jgi:hypothetical protein